MLKQRIIDFIVNETRPIKWFVENMRNNSLIVDNSFQRRYVWLEDDKIRLIETILLGYTIPEVYLWEQDVNPDTGDTTYSIVDGQQRIRSVLDFIEGKFALFSKHLEKNSKYANLKFEQLDAKDKSKIWAYPFTVRFVNRLIEKEDIIEMFLRLNSTNMTLNPQELRNAKFNGEFINLSNEISEFEFWEEYKIFNKSQLRRMSDIQFVSRILMFLRLGIEQDTYQENINRMYDQFNEKYEEAEQDKKMFKQMLSVVEQFMDDNRKNIEFLRKETHLYSVLVVAYNILATKQKVKKENIESFSRFVLAYVDDEYKKQNFSTQEVRNINKYKELSVEGTQKKAHRATRIKLLKQFMKVK